MLLPPPRFSRPATIDGRAAVLVVEGTQVVCVEVELRAFDDEVQDASIRAVIAAAGFTCGVSPNIAWVEGGAGADGVWRGVARFHPLGWRPKDGLALKPPRPRRETRGGPRFRG